MYADNVYFVLIMMFYGIAAENGNMLAIDRAVYLQRYAEGWRDGKWETRADFRPCIDKTHFAQVTIAVDFKSQKIF